MDADYSIELGPTSPALEVPWRDPEGRLHYFNLRTNPAAIEHLPEAAQFPALCHFLTDLNSQHSLWQTVKCDVWSEEAIPAENLYDAAFTHCCYVDLILAEETPSGRDNLDLHQGMAKHLALSLEAHEALEASAEIVVRRCYFHRDVTAEDSDPGYCLTLFLTGYGSSPTEASRSWQQALEVAAQTLLQVPSPDDRAKA